jgi:hypothetical protein
VAEWYLTHFSSWLVAGGSHDRWIPAIFCLQFLIAASSLLIPSDERWAIATHFSTDASSPRREILRLPPLGGEGRRGGRDAAMDYQSLRHHTSLTLPVEGEGTGAIL